MTTGRKRRPTTMTPRERDPQVWAATYGAALAADFARLYEVADGNGHEKHAHALSQVAQFAPLYVLLADAAVMALHPDGTSANLGGYVRTEADRAHDRGAAIEAFKANVAALR
jgi:hypothetical protein